MLTEETDKKITYKKIFILWIPLAAMWLVMGIEQPLINGVITRMGNIKANLAAFGITYSIALIIEAPIIQMLATATALIDSKNNYKRLMTFMHFMAAGTLLLHLILGLTPAYNLLLKDIMGIPEHLIPLSRRAFIWMTPWGAAIGYRRLWQGILIRYEKTKIIPVTMGIRLSIMALTLFMGNKLLNLEGAELGGLSLSCGVIAGAVSSYLYFLPIKKSLKENNEQNLISWNRLLQFYYPLVLTSFFTFIVRPVINFGLARAAFPLESLAVWPVVLSLMFLLQSMALAYQEVVVSLLNSSRFIHLLSRFALVLGAVLSGIMLIAGLTPLSTLIYGKAGGLDDVLLSFTGLSTILVALIPLLSALLSWYRGLLIFRHSTGAIAAATLLNSAVLILVMLTGPLLLKISGVYIAAGAFTVSMAAETIYLKLKT